MTPKLAQRLVALACLLAAAGTVFSAFPSKATPFSELVPPGIGDGAGLWVNMWHYPSDNLDAYCTNLKNNGITNLFVQTSRTNTDAIVNREGLTRIIETCHRHGMRVIAWSYAELLYPAAEAEKMVVAANFTTPAGERLDGIAPNLEKNLVEAKVIQYSQYLRDKLGPNYPMMAVVYSPLNRAAEVRRCPWKVLARYYDVIAPMAYWNSKWQSFNAYEYTVSTIQKVRQLTGRPDVEVHVVGDGMGTRFESITEFLRGCRQAEAAGASLYPNHLPTPEQMQAMSRYHDFLKPNSRFRLAAFHEMLRTNAIDAPPDRDPCRAMPRGAFYQLIVRHLGHALPRHHGVRSLAQAVGSPSSAGYTPVAYRQAGPEEALNVLTAAQVVALPQNHDINAVLSAPISAGEALAILARVVEASTSPRERAAKTHKHWTSQPVHAAVVPSETGSALPLNYLDASQMVLQAGSAVR